MQDLLIMEQVDVRRADDPEDSKALTITKMGLPKLTRKMVEHTPGGGIGSVKFVLPQLDAFEPTFSVKGLDAKVMREFGFVPGQYDKWTFAGTLRNTRLNKVVPMRCTLRGVIASWSPNEHTPGELIDCDHALHEVTYSDLLIDGEEIWAWGFYERIGRGGGVDWFSPYKSALGA